jgi:hypothetical protein
MLPRSKLREFSLFNLVPSGLLPTALVCFAVVGLLVLRFNLTESTQMFKASNSMIAKMQIESVSNLLFNIQFHIIDLHRFVLFGGFSFTFIIQSSNRPRNQPAEPRNPTLLKTASGFGPGQLRAGC